MWLGRLDSNQYLRGNNPVGCQLTLHPKEIVPRHRREQFLHIRNQGSVAGRSHGATGSALREQPWQWPSLW